MLIHLPVLSMVLAASATAGADSGATANRDAQVQLADTLGNADAILAIHGGRNRVVFDVVRDGEALEVAARTDHGAVVELAIRDIGAADDLDVEPGLSWLGDVMKDTTAVTRLDVDRDGAVTLVTSDGQRYMAIPGRGSGGNDAVEARWAASWDHS